ncbi:BTB/POZ domain protein [Rhizoctonia solani 123E]|uniref:BTB/POZ domain protein n=1 Tax=Rhizoctonia solani 123E TaxID=1423351 RepID=A0A074RMG6_9AGAM|nr:BTB/POZ domain protein [Rhizoctonia solani 123E]
MTADSIPTVNEGFTRGGDLTLRSTDGIQFSVHSILLSLASPVLSELFQNGNKNQVIQFSENAEVLALMLKFVYPTSTPAVSTMSLLNDGIRVANKYQIESMKTRLREQLVLVDSPVSVYSNPLGVLYIASTHGFTAEAGLAASLASEQCDFGKGDDLKKVLDAAPIVHLIPAATALIKLTGIPLVKTRALMDVLYHFERSPMTLYNDSTLIGALLCRHCQGIYGRAKRQILCEWQARWAHWIFEQVRDRPFAEWKAYFSHSNFNGSFYQPHMPASFCSYGYCEHVPTCECANRVNQSAAEFQAWADGVYGCLKSRLTFVAELEAQIHNPETDPKRV